MNKIIPFNRQEIIDENRKEIEERLKKNPTAAEAILVSNDRLNEVLKIVDSVGNNLDHREQIITKAAYFLGAISWAQPFGGANKRTGFIMVVIFLRDNGYDLEIPEYDEARLISLLYDIQEERSTLSHEIIENLILYMKERTIRYEQSY